MFQIVQTLTYRNLYSNIFDDSLNLGVILTVMILFSFLYFALAWYIEKVLPGEYGVSWPFYFPFMVCFINLFQYKLNFE
jgi:hypothetical protein